MNRRLRFFLFFLTASLLFPATDHFAAHNKTVKVFLFWAKGCPHCLHEKEFLAKLEKQRQNIQVISLELTESRENRELLKKAGVLLGVDVSGVPFTVVGNQYVVGWIDEKTTGQALEKAIQNVQDTGAPDLVGQLLPVPAASPTFQEKRPIPDKLTVPFWGEIEIKYLSLGTLTLIIGLLDGFNPCAMWVLIFLINLLLGMEDRKKMWVLGGTFILVSGFVYFLFMAAWLNLILFLGFIVWIRVIIGLIALAAGGYNLKEYFTDTSGACKVTASAPRQRKMERIKNIIQTRKFSLALGGIILLALAVNLVELICSAGFPVVYLQVLSLTPMPVWKYYLYLVFYIVLYMLDDMIIFVVAMVTLQLMGVTTQYKRASSLIGGVLMLIIGILLLVKPEALMFG